MAEPKRHNPKTTDEEQNRLDGGAVANPDGIAATLRDARTKMGVDLRDAADVLRIQYTYLRAIEDGRYTDLPGPTYALGFVRAYAEYLGLDGREVVRRFKEEARGLSRRQALVFPEPLQEGRFPGGSLLVIALVIAAGVYFGWNYWQQKHTAQIDAVSPPPATLASRKAPESAAPPAVPSAPSPAATPTPSEAQASSLLPAESGTAVSGSNAPRTASPGTAGPGTAGPVAAAPMTEPSPAAGQAAAAADTLPAASSGVSPVIPTPAPKPADISARVSTGAAAPPAAPPDETASLSPSAPEQVASVKPSEPRVYGENNAASRITLAARQDSWVQVRDKDSNVVWTRMLRSGDSYKVPNQPGLTLLTGNAGALDVWVDGRAAPPLGPEGAVRRSIALDPDKIASGAAGNQ